VESLSYFKLGNINSHKSGDAMKENSRIKFNPVTKEIEIEGSEGFVTACFDKIQAIMSGNSEATAEVKKSRRGRKPKAEKIAPAKKELKAKAAKPGPKNNAEEARKVAKKEPGAKRVTQIDMIVGFVQGSAEGISTAELKEKTGLDENQIWNIVNRATKLGKIRKVKRGLYGAA
jgi:hypothetical protein